MSVGKTGARKKWTCPVCNKALAGSPRVGKVTLHANRNGEACSGASKPAVGAKDKTRSGAPSREKKRQPAKLTAGAKPATLTSNRKAQLGAKSVPQPQVKRRDTARHKDNRDAQSKATARQAAADEYWSLFGDVLRQDLETDRNWRRVRLGTSQGTGRRR